MSFPFPLNPADGQQVTQAQSDGSVLVATYHQAKNEWIVNRQLPAPTPLTGTPPINVTATANGQVITWDQALKTWTAKTPGQSGGTGGTYSKPTQAAADTSNPPDPTKPTVTLKPGMLQSTLEKLHKEIKAWNGTAWTEVLAEDTIKQWVAAGSLFRGVVKEATLNTLPVPATANRGFYYSWTGNPGRVVVAGDAGIGGDLAGEILQVGDWIQSDGTKWVHVPGDLLSKQRWDSLGSFAPWSDTSWEKGSVVSYQKSFFRSNALVSPGDLAPDATGSKWTDITPLPSIKLADLADVNDNAALSGNDGVVVWAEIDGEFVVSREITVNGIEFDATGPGTILEGFMDGDLSVNKNLTTQVPSCEAVATYVDTRSLEDFADTKGLDVAADGEFIAWDDASNGWVPKQSAAALAGMTDVDLTTKPPVASNFLSFNGTKWVPAREDGGLVNKYIQGNAGPLEVDLGSKDWYQINLDAMVEYRQSDEFFTMSTKTSAGNWTQWGTALKKVRAHAQKGLEAKSHNDQSVAQNGDWLVLSWANNDATFAVHDAYSHVKVKITRMYDGWLMMETEMDYGGANGVQIAATTFWEFDASDPTKDIRYLVFNGYGGGVRLGMTGRLTVTK
jgi:hypothetical protein